MSKADLKKISEKRLKVKVAGKHKKDTKLKDLERQLEFAECRCGALKQQLDYIKALYGEGKLKYPEKQLHREEGHGDGSNLNKFTLSDHSRWDNSDENFENRETSKFTGTSIYRNEVVSCPSSDLGASKHNSEHEPKKRDTKHKNHLKVFKSKKKNSKKSKNKSKRTGNASLSKVSNVSSQTQTLSAQDPVVEIYKNSALNAESESGLEIVSKKNISRMKYSAQAELSQKEKCKATESECKESEKKLFDDFKIRSCNSINTENFMNSKLKDENMPNNIHFDLSHLDRIKENIANELSNKKNFLRTSNNFFEPSKNYWQPTISSKKKQTDKDVYSNLKHMKIRNIPFVAAKSTAPSHNINVNIQQVLSIIKKRQRVNDNFFSIPPENENLENSLINTLNSKKQEDQGQEPNLSEANLPGANKKRIQPPKSNLSHWKSNTNIDKHSSDNSVRAPTENQSRDWSFKVNKLKRVLMFLHEDFTFLSQKYKKLQKKLTKRNISKTDAKDELAEIERSLEKKEEEIIVVIGLYKEVLNLREDFKKLQEKYESVTYGRSSVFEGLKQSTSTHAQMTKLLRKIQNLQDQLKN